MTARGRPSADDAALIAGRIVEAAWQVLLETGPEQFSLDRVAAMAHASKQTIYARFSGKPELLQAVLAARIGPVLAGLGDPGADEDLEAAIAGMTRRIASSLTAPEAFMLDRLIDWVDTALTHGRACPTRQAIYEELHGVLQRYLEGAAAQAGLTIGDADSAASFWLDSLIGHIRGLPREGARLEQWPVTFARYFIRAISPR